MPVQNIECQLAQGQINRYLAGDTLSEAALQQLEAHVGECADCKAFLYEKRSSLFSILGHAAPEPQAEVAPAEDSSPKAKSLISAIRSKKSAPQPEAEPVAMPTHAVIEVDSDVVPQTPKLFAKPLLYSAGLALVLIFMSTVMRDPTRFLGDSVNETLPTAKSTTPAPSGAPKAATPAAATTTGLGQQGAPETSTSKPVTESQPTSANGSETPSNSETASMKPAGTPEPSTTPEATAAPTSKHETTTQEPPRSTTNSSTPAPTAPAPVRQPVRPASTRTTPRADRPRSNPRRSAPAASRPTQQPRPSGIRLYDANGNPINP